MSVTYHNKPLNMRVYTGILKPLCIELKTDNCKPSTAYTSAKCTNCTAVAAAEQSAALVSFQRKQKSLPPIQNADSAPLSLTSACQFSGDYAIYAENAENLQFPHHF